MENRKILVIEMHRNMQSYERHLREEYSNKISE